MTVCFIHFHHVHSLVRSSLSEPHNCIFAPPLWPGALGSRLVRLMVSPQCVMYDSVGIIILST